MDYHLFGSKPSTYRSERYRKFLPLFWRPQKAFSSDIILTRFGRGARLLGDKIGFRLFLYGLTCLDGLLFNSVMAMGQWGSCLRLFTVRQPTAVYDKLSVKGPEFCTHPVCILSGYSPQTKATRDSWPVGLNCTVCSQCQSPIASTCDNKIKLAVFNFRIWNVAFLEIWRNNMHICNAYHLVGINIGYGSTWTIINYYLPSSLPQILYAIIIESFILSTCHPISRIHINYVIEISLPLNHGQSSSHCAFVTVVEWPRVWSVSTRGVNWSPKILDLRKCPNPVRASVDHPIFSWTIFEQAISHSKFLTPWLI